MSAFRTGRCISQYFLTNGDEIDERNPDSCGRSLFCRAEICGLTPKKNSGYLAFRPFTSRIESGSRKG
jgi:hypothetical protein